tara:strand:+ start:311 stop:1024 length:714 start_codon:yes stop_codon:yes gene_type:complete
MFKNGVGSWGYIVLAFLVIVFIRAYTSNNSDNNSNSIKYTKDEKKVIEVCKLYADQLYDIDFKGTPKSCYLFLNTYRKGINDQVDKLYGILIDSYTNSNMSTKKITSLGKMVKTHMGSYDCRFKKFAPPSSQEKLITCMSAIKSAPEALIGFIEITNDYNRTQRARSLSKNMNRTTGDKLIEMGLHLSGIGTKKSSSGTSNSQTGFTKVCIKDGIGGKKSVTVGAVELCPIGYKELK